MARRLCGSAGLVIALAGTAAAQAPAPPPAPVIVIKAGRLFDPESGTIATSRMILVENHKISAIGPKVDIPKGATVIDLSQQTVMPGFVDAHNHLAITYKVHPERNNYYITYITESTALRAIEAASNGIQMLAAGFTIVRDMGNNGNYADVALRQAIERGWIPGPTIIPSGIIMANARDGAREEDRLSGVHRGRHAG